MRIIGGQSARYVNGRDRPGARSPATASGVHQENTQQQDYNAWRDITKQKLERTHLRAIVGFIFLEEGTIEKQGTNRWEDGA
jgi:hypothetical protein